jgi:hypothetical protein
VQRTDTWFRVVSLAIVVLVLASLLVLLLGPGRGAREDLATMDRNVALQLGEIQTQVELTDELVERSGTLIALAAALEERAARLEELAEELGGQGEDALEIARRLDLRSAELVELAARLDLRAAELVGLTVRSVEVAEQQLGISQQLTGQLDASLDLQRAAVDVARQTLQEVREINDKIPPPTGGGILPGAASAPAER